jgi:hypothetical protein
MRRIRPQVIARSVTIAPQRSQLLENPMGTLLLQLPLARLAISWQVTIPMLQACWQEIPSCTPAFPLAASIAIQQEQVRVRLPDVRRKRIARHRRPSPISQK